jgi:hypothetical protein
MNAVTQVPVPVNEPVRAHAAGSAELAAPRRRIAQKETFVPPTGYRYPHQG